jgi:hypothetical protein
VPLMCSVTSELTRRSEHHIFKYQHCLSSTICNSPRINCSYRVCSECPEPTDLEGTLGDALSDKATANITFTQWISRDKCKLVATVQSSEAFIESLFEKLLLLFPHPLTATQHSVFLKELTCKHNQVSLCLCVTSLKIILSFCKIFHWNNA